MSASDVAYLDAAAGTPLHPAARDALIAALDAYGDPRARHAAGRAARRLVERARAQLADAIGAEADEILFAGGAAEANAMAILGVAHATPGGRIVVGVLEHPSILDAARASGLEVVEVDCDEHGRVDVDRFAAEVARPRTLIASVGHASHALGAMQPLAECASIARAHGVLTHADACQTLPSLPVDVRALGVDLLTVSANTAYGPPGVAALFVRRGLAVDPLLHAGGHSARGPESNVPGIAAMGAAVEALTPEVPELAGRLWRLSARLRRGLEEAGILVIGHATQRVPQIVTWAVEDVDDETLLMTLEDRGILAGLVEAAPLARVGLASRGAAVVRMSLHRETTEADIDRVLDRVPDAVRSLREMAVRAGSARREPGRRPPKD